MRQHAGEAPYPEAAAQVAVVPFVDRSAGGSCPPARLVPEESEFSLMVTTIFRIDAPPIGIEITGKGSNPTEEEMEEELKARQAFLDAVSPHLAALRKRPDHRSGNVVSVDLHGADVWSRLNQYLLMVTVDIGDPRIDFDSFLPTGSTVKLVGSDFTPLSHWPDGNKT
ncbi:hypothetical protein [Kitasatospora sp. KL5]|uniref:hypothetical protein n=1 Tax=Kitasatospora sp. KL5 TaxID=3425125 RepID=UPI003D6E4B64